MTFHAGDQTAAHTLYRIPGPGRPLLSARARIEAAPGRHETALENLLELARLDDVDREPEFEAIGRLPARGRIMRLDDGDFPPDSGTSSRPATVTYGR